jgi:hypothetical protein
VSRAVVPMRSFSMRLPEAGRIRIGTSKKATSRNGKEFDQPVKLDRFRFTSSDPVALGQVAELYGGTVLPWTHAKAAAGQFEVTTDAREIRIALPPDPLGNTPIYEMWEGGGCQRRCDGEVCETPAKGADGVELQQIPCICAAKGALACKVTTRLSVLLPEIRFVGVWRLDSHGWNAAQELPGMVELIRSLQDRGVVRGLLRVEARSQVLGGETRDFMVPVLGVDESVEALASGASRLNALGTGPGVPALEAGTEGEDQQPSADPNGNGGTPEPASPSDRDNEIVDAEIVGDDRTLADVLPEGVSPSKALVIAQRIIREQGGEKPTALEQVTDYRVQTRVLDELGLIPTEAPA